MNQNLQNLNYKKSSSWIFSPILLYFLKNVVGYDFPGGLQVLENQLQVKHHWLLVHFENWTEDDFDELLKMRLKSDRKMGIKQCFPNCLPLTDHWEFHKGS